MPDDTDQFSPSIDGILENVGRLLEDAEYLGEGGRYASAFVLSVIALEEVGKIIRERWNDMKLKATRHDRTAHLQKQWAVACLLIIDSIHDDLSARTPTNELDLIAMAEKFIESSGFLRSVMFKRLDRAKQLGLYWDSENAKAGRTTDHLDKASVDYIRGRTLAAVALLDDNLKLLMANIYYESLPTSALADLNW